ncbi:transcriptional regulator, TetR family [Actinopolyspora mzabensis]|uniref:Transcriptional regulator, TetR family n=1 Tax=Actinopolyspora mzabensis TaxID=995066 RepID=A0A1G8Z6J1_ACTMZ|nr:TetR/AcrR family transcriptional regulator [Actinopolyspora mzabensis]SDK10686.1 transcriptional regulator, TetR family [Actinopolyspora mzabensis]
MAATAKERGREARERLLRAAAELITERGWTGVTTRAVAERAGVTAGIVHYHFDSVDALLAETAVGTMRAATAWLETALEQVGSADEALTTLLAALDSYGGNDPESVLFVEAYLAATRDPGLLERISAVLTDLRKALADRFIEHGITDAEASAAVVVASLDGLMLHRDLNPALTTGTVRAVLRRLLTTEQDGEGNRHEETADEGARTERGDRW